MPFNNILSCQHSSSSARKCSEQVLTATSKNQDCCADTILLGE